MRESFFSVFKIPKNAIIEVVAAAVAVVLVVIVMVTVVAAAGVCGALTMCQASFKTI